MASRIKLTEKLVKAAAPRASDYEIFDEEVRGFALRVYKSGERSFVLFYRVAGRRRRYLIGPWPEWSVVAARERAKFIRREIDAGVDPMAERQKARQESLVLDLIERYIEEHLPRLAPRNAKDQASMLRKLIAPEIGHLRVRETTPAHIERMLRKIAEGRARPHKENPKTRRRRPLAAPKPTPIRANRAGEVVRKMFGLGIKWRMCDENPASGFRKYVENEREHFLSLPEIERLATALAETEDQRGANIIRMCMLTGARLGEVRCARFEQFNLDLLVWTKPASTTKQRRMHRLVISPEVAAIVRQRRAAVEPDCPWLFPGDAEGKDQPVQEIRRFWMAIQRKAGLKDVRIHDLRHTYASLLASGGASLPMIGRLLGHTQQATTQRYAHLADASLRAAVNEVAELMKPRLRIVE